MSVVHAGLAKHGRGFLPADEDGEALHKRMELGEYAEFKVILPRSVKWHKMYFGICTEIGQNQDPVRDKDSIDHELRIRAGHYEVIFVDGHEVRYPKRIAFDQLTADEWATLWPSLELAIREHFGESYIWDRQL